jgi:hypothetical protein
VTSNIARWQKWRAILDKPIVAESVRWGDYRRDVHRFNDGRFVLYTRERHWLPENDRITKSYLVKRNAIVLRQLREAGLIRKGGAGVQPARRKDSSGVQARHGSAQGNHSLHH